MRYHPAIVAQKAAMVVVLSAGRFRLGVGAGENLNEHVVGRGWPPVQIRHEMLEEAIEIIRAPKPSPTSTTASAPNSADSAHSFLGTALSSSGLPGERAGTSGRRAGPSSGAARCG
jgi:hypothetical protein